MSPEQKPGAKPEQKSRVKGLGPVVEDFLLDYFAAHGTHLPAKGLYDRVLREVERPLLKLALQATEGNQIKAAQMLGLNRNTLRTKLARHKLRAEKYKGRH